ncbi:17810_t:CDS:2, partial [Cetraspora pellucida]
QSKSITQIPQSMDKAIDFHVGYVFTSWEDVDTIIKAYGIKHGFTIIKKRLSYHENGSIKHRSFGCEFGSHY